MIMCGEKKIYKGEREGSGAGIPPGRTLGGGRKYHSGTKKHSYVTISNRS